MTELEQLRKEVNELRERVAKLEVRPFSLPLPYAPRDFTQPPYWTMKPYSTCEGTPT